jgi:hypothetical protein
MTKTPIGLGPGGASCNGLTTHGEIHNPYHRDEPLDSRRVTPIRLHAGERSRIFARALDGSTVIVLF